MTALAERRRRTTITAGVAGLVMLLVASAMVVVGIVTLSNSREGEAVGVDDRPHEQFPATPNSLVAVTDDEGQLASVVVLTLLPDGQGGSIVTVPVNADANAGFGAERRPLDQAFDPDNVEGFVADVEGMLSIAIQRAAVVRPDELDALLPPFETLEIVLPQDVIDSSAAGDGIDDAPVVEDDEPEDDDGGEPDQGESGGGEGEAEFDADNGLVVGAGPQTLTRAQVLEVLTAIDDDGAAYDRHELDVEVWAALARSAPITTPPEPVSTDETGRPTAPTSVAELVERLWEGEVGVRDIATVRLVASDNPTDEDVVLLDRRDSTLIFTQISPGLVSTATTGMRVRVVAPFTQEQLEAAGYASSSDLLLEFIGSMMFVQASVVSIDSSPSGAGDITLVDAAQPVAVTQIESSVDALFGPSEVALAETVIDGVDIVVTLGTGYFSRDTTVAESDGSVPPDGSVPLGTSPLGTETTGTVAPDATVGD